MQADDVSPQDIVVTALRREQNLKDVPVAVTALSQETLIQANVRDTRDLQTLTPGLRMDVTGQYLQPALRGVTSTLLNIANDSPRRACAEMIVLQLRYNQQGKCRAGNRNAIFPHSGRSLRRRP